MIDLKQKQQEIVKNKIDKGFNTTNIEKEFCMLTAEVSEAYEAYAKKKNDLGSELADVAIFLMGISELLGFNLEDEINKKIEINKKRKYKLINGVYEKVEN